ncbi:hypothetical protein [Nostoc sp.]|uniref:hypothetical protein n=1 Tax=Nostoc sp. TaxID=1180 RepID=UPI002FF9B50F
MNLPLPASPLTFPQTKREIVGFIRKVLGDMAQAIASVLNQNGLKTIADLDDN